MNENASNPGKGLGTGGFVLSLVAIVGYFIVGGIATLAAIASPGGGTTTMIVWIVICALALLLSYMGFKKSSAVGAKKGLATAGIVISLVALVLSVWALIGLREVSNSPELQKAREEMKDAINKGMEDIKEDIKEEIEESKDSTGTM